MVVYIHVQPLSVCAALRENCRSRSAMTAEVWNGVCCLGEWMPVLVQTLLANGLVAPNAVSSLIAALAAPEMPRQQPPAPAVLTDPELAAALSYQAPAQQVPDPPEHHPLNETHPVFCKSLEHHVSTLA